MCRNKEKQNYINTDVIGVFIVMKSTVTRNIVERHAEPGLCDVDFASAVNVHRANRSHV